MYYGIFVDYINNNKTQDLNDFIKKSKKEEYDLIYSKYYILFIIYLYKKIFANELKDNKKIDKIYEIFKKLYLPYDKDKPPTREDSSYMEQIDILIEELKNDDLLEILNNLKEMLCPTLQIKILTQKSLDLQEKTDETI